MHRYYLFLTWLAVAFTLAACSPPSEPPAASRAPTPDAQAPDKSTAQPTRPDDEARQPAASELAGTSWQLVEIRSMDDSSWAPEDSSRYTLVFDPAGDAYMQLDCNRGRAGWKSEEANILTFSPVASTSALCNDDGLSERYASQFEFVRSYTFRDGRLYLATFADGAILEFRPAE